MASAKSIFTSFCIVLSLNAVSYALECKQKAYTQRHRGLVLTKNVIAIHNVRWLTECLMKCSLNEHCKSYSYQLEGDQEMRACELNNDTIGKCPFTPHKTKHGYVYYEEGNIAAGKYEYGTKGWPGASCLNIRQSGIEQSGEYYICMDDTEPLKVFCDMTTDGGGWTLVSSIVVNLTRFNWSISTDYRDIANYSRNNVGLSSHALGALWDRMPFSQMRFHCRKDLPSRTFHIITARNSSGEKVWKFFTSKNKILPEACGSFHKMADDTSWLAANCSRWTADASGKWGTPCEQDFRRSFFFPVFIRGVAHWRVGQASSNHWECDDWRKPVSPGDFWKIYVR